MKLYKVDSDIHQKVEKVARLMDELDLSFEVLCGNIIASDSDHDRVVIINAESGEETMNFPVLFSDFRLKVWNT